MGLDVIKVDVYDVLTEIREREGEGIEGICKDNRAIGQN